MQKAVTTFQCPHLSEVLLRQGSRPRSAPSRTIPTTLRRRQWQHHAMRVIPWHHADDHSRLSWACCRHGARSQRRNLLGVSQRAPTVKNCVPLSMVTRHGNMSANASTPFFSVYSTQYPHSFMYYTALPLQFTRYSQHSVEYVLHAFGLFVHDSAIYFTCPKYILQRIQHFRAQTVRLVKFCTAGVRF